MIYHFLSRTSISHDAPVIEAARIAVIDATLMLRDLILRPEEYLMDFNVSVSKYPRHLLS